MASSEDTLTGNVIKDLTKVSFLMWELIFSDFDSKLKEDLYYSNNILVNQYESKEQNLIQQLELSDRRSKVLAAELERYLAAIDENKQCPNSKNSAEIEIKKESKNVSNVNDSKDNGKKDADKKDNNDNTTDDKKILLTGKDHFKAGFIGSMASDLVGIAERQIGIRKRLLYISIHMMLRVNLFCFLCLNFERDSQKCPEYSSIFN